MTSINFQIKKDSATIQREVLTNIVKMLFNRKWISLQNIDKVIKNLVEKKNDEGTYTIPLDVDLLEVPTYEEEDKSKWKNFNGRSVALLIIKQKIAGKSQTVNDFVSKNENSHKIIVADGLNEKAKQLILQSTNNKSIETFIEEEFMFSLFEMDSCPAYEVLTNKEADALRESYKLNKRHMPKILITDPASRHLYLKREQIVRIIRDSRETGKEISYRLVILKGNSAM
jgi:DNA-directed RNA polymerase subunit H (RpoH/RPB5)